MSGASIEVDIIGEAFAGLEARLRTLSSGADHYSELLESIGAVVESQTRRRIQEEKTGPSGRPWRKWAKRTAKRRHGGQSLLKYDGNLLDSIEAQLTADKTGVEVGTSMKYGAAQQYGMWISVVETQASIKVPARPYLGLSRANNDEVTEMIEDFVNELMGGATL